MGRRMDFDFLSFTAVSILPLLRNPRTMWKTILIVSRRRFLKDMWKSYS